MFQPISFLINFTESELWFIGFCLVLSVLDIITGWVQAIINNSFSSTKMREGLLHKVVLILIIMLAVIIQGFTQHIGDTGWDIPLIYGVCLYIAIMEVSSIVENFGEAVPQLKDSKLLEFFENSKYREDSESIDKE